MKAKLTAAIVGCTLVLLLFYQHGFLNKALLPGFYLSAMLTISGDSGYGKPYYVLGLVINAAIFSYIIFRLLISPKPLHELRRLVTPGRIICVVTLVLFVVYALPVFAVVHARWLVRNMPAMWIVPTPLPIVPIERSEGLKLSYYGYEFEVPWTQLNREQKLRSMTVLNFGNGAVVVFHEPAEEMSELKVMKQGERKQGLTVEDIFGDKATSSNYAFRSKILYLTPKDLRLSFSRQEMAANSGLILLKLPHAGLAKGGEYSFQTEWLRGFQDGDPAIDTMTIINCFDAQDREIEIWVGSTEGKKKPSQADVNRIIYSLRPATASSPT